MEQPFNRRQGATSRTFSLGRLVLAKDYRGGVKKWIVGSELRRTGRVTYGVRVKSFIRVRHAKRLRTPLKPVAVLYSRAIPLDILPHTFDLPQNVLAVTQSSEAHSPSIYTPKIWTDRSRKRVVHTHVNSGQRSYEQ
ncbi:hypothetical protein PHET_06756 [Paragonimus heterotremus]|uniref:Uncharacterized protein n=1 Tax=Paragonimus heterotremus TaxID=100268 RepID=A0A8J4SNF5_9TREM|nr:hypothetical protein PHET_06756 [Paragonimus heterotremus]